MKLYTVIEGGLITITPMDYPYWSVIVDDKIFRVYKYPVIEIMRECVGEFDTLRDALACGIRISK